MSTISLALVVTLTVAFADASFYDELMPNVCKASSHLSDLLISAGGLTDLPACCVIERDLMSRRREPEALASDAVAPDLFGLNEMVPSFGQFSLSHDNAHTTTNASEIVSETCGGDFSFTIEANAKSEGCDGEVNVITACTDASNVYGSGEDGRLESLVDEDTGMLIVNEDMFPPQGRCPMGNPKRRAADTLFCVGDKRGNENPQLLVHHVIWLREHNWWARRLRRRHPDWSGATVFKRARANVIAEMQKVTAYELLPAMLGEANALPAFSEACTQPATGDVKLFKEFSQAIWRVPHGMINDNMEVRESPHGGAIRTRSIDSVFFVPEVASSFGVERLLAGAMLRPTKRLDPIYPSGLLVSRSPLSPNIHLGAKDCIRGRGSSMPTYAETKAFLGGDAVTGWEGISSSGAVQDQLEAVYGAGNWNNVDLLVGSLAEDHLEGSSTGFVFAGVVKEQMQQIRCEDPNWFERKFRPRRVRRIMDTTYADIILRNTSPDLLPEVPMNVFKVPSAHNPLISRTCEKQMAQ